MMIIIYRYNLFIILQHILPQVSTSTQSHGKIFVQKLIVLHFKSLISADISYCILSSFVWCHIYIF